MSFEIKSKLKWNGSSATAGFEVANVKALTESAILVEGKAVGNTAGHRVTGNLSQSITRNVRKELAVVGTPIEYAPYEEFGTRYRGPHPFLRPAFAKSIQAINNIFKKLYKAVKYVD